MTDNTMEIYRTLSSERYTPYSLARKIGAIGILESASFQKGRQRYSILMAKEAFKITQEDDGVYFLVDGNKIPFNSEKDSLDAMGHKKKPDILDALSYVALQHKDFTEAKDIPLPASGMGYLSYEFARRCDNIRFFEQEDELGIPECLFVAGHIYIIFDHFTEKIHIFGLNYNEHKINLEDEVEKFIRRFNDMDFSYVGEEAQTFEYKMILKIYDK